MKTTVILVHGAFADGSSWGDVIPSLEQAGYDVIAVQNPLTSYADDVATTRRALQEHAMRLFLADGYAATTVGAIAAGVLIGLEVACRSTWLQPDLSDRLYHLIAHEYGHVQQPETLEDGTNTVLKQSLIEGVAELIAELASGQVSNVQLQRWTRGREAEIDWRFLVDADKTDLSDWLYNGPGTPDHPGDLGYWVGYRIAKAYYRQASDKRAALRTLLELRDPKAILAQDQAWEYPIVEGPAMVEASCGVDGDRRWRERDGFRAADDGQS